MKVSHIQKIWNYMRRNRHFTMSDIGMIVTCSRDYLKDTVRRLELAGYVKKVSTERESMRVTYRMVRNTGVKAPQLSAKRAVDNNTGETFHIRGLRINEPILRFIVTNDLRQFSYHHIQAQVQSASKNGIHLILKRLSEKGVIEKVGKGVNGVFYYAVNTEYKNILTKEIHEKDIAICPVCHSVHTATKIKKQIFDFNNRRNKE